MVISRLACSGLIADDLDLSPAAITSFTSNIATLSTSKGSYYYVPTRFNFKAIDALHVKINKGRGGSTARITGIQIIINKDHKNTEEMFFNQWDDWIGPLKGFHVEASFLWIVEGKRGGQEVEEKVTELQSRNLLNWPKYTIHLVSVEQIDRQLAYMLAYIHPNHWTGDPSGCGIGRVEHGYG
jgi:hypothetical protein